MNKTPLLVLLALAACAGDQPLGDDRLSVQVTIGDVSPARVPSTGGAEITLTGRNLPEDAVILVDGVPAPGSAWRDAGRMTFVSPPLGAGVHQLVVRAAGRDLVAPVSLRVYAALVAFREEPEPWAAASEQLTWDATVSWRTGDLDGDDRDDLTFWRHESEHLGSTRVFVSDGAGAAHELLSLPRQPAPVAILDADGDGLGDLVDRVGLRLRRGEGFAERLPLVAADEDVGAAAWVATAPGVRRLLVAVSGGNGQLSWADVAGDSVTLEPIAELPYVNVRFGDSELGWKNPDHLAVLDFDGDGADDVAYTSWGRAVIVRGPSFTSHWEVAGDFGAFQGRRSDVDGDGRNELLVATTTELTVLGWDGEALVATPYGSVCGLNVPIRGFAPGRDGVDLDRVAVLCAREVLVLRWFDKPGPALGVLRRLPRMTMTAQVSGTGHTLSFDAPEQILPRFARLDGNARAGFLYLENDGPSGGAFTGKVVAWYGDDLGVIGYDSGVPTYPAGAVVAPWTPANVVDGTFAAQRLVAVLPAGTVVARGPGDADALTLDLGLVDEDIEGVTHCDLDGEPGDDLAVLSRNVLGPSLARLRIVHVGAAGLRLGAVLTVREGVNEPMAVRALDADGDGDCDLFTSDSVGSYWERNVFYLGGEAGWQEQVLDGILPYGNQVGGPPIGSELVLDVDDDGDDDLFVVEVASGRRGLWVGENQGASFAWRALTLPVELAEGAFSDQAVHDGRIWLSMQQSWPPPAWGRYVAGRVEGDRFVVDTATEAGTYDSTGIFFGDADGDGTDDLLTRQQVFPRGPDGGLRAPVAYSLGHLGHFGAARDLDGDGLAELVGLTREGKLVWARNRSR